MNKRLKKIFKIIVLILILPLFAIAFAPPIKTNAACADATGSQIQVSGGLISAINIHNFSASTSVDVSCIIGIPASIPQFSIQDYEAMKKDYFDQAKSTYNKITLPGNQVQSSPSSPLNLLSL